MDDLENLETLNDLKKDKQRKKKKGLKRSSEESEQELVVRFLNSNYPDVMFRASPEGIRLSIGMATKLKRQGLLQKGLPDLEIFEPKGNYCGLFIEMKKSDFSLYKNNGELKKDDHIKEQKEKLEKLYSKGYFTSFAKGYSHAKEIIKYYMQEDKISLYKNRLI